MLSGCGVSEQVGDLRQRIQTENSGGVTIENSENEGVLSNLLEEYRRLTIPYLRKQEFPGSDVEVIRQVSENANYTSYVASYKSEGLTIYGLLTKPKGDEPESGFPAVVFVHGYIPPLSYKTTEKYGDYVDYLARNGLVVFKIDLRGHGESEGEPGGAYFSSDYIFDTLNARSSLKKLSYVNSSKVGLWGHSMAGNVVLRSMTVDPTIPAGVIWAGAVYTYTDMRELGIQDGSYQPSQNPNRNRRQELMDRVGDVSANNEFWKMVIPTNYVSDLLGVVEIHHAINDDVVSVEYGRNLQKILEDAGKKSRLYEYTNGGHNISSPAFGSAMSRTVKTFLEM